MIYEIWHIETITRIDEVEAQSLKAAQRKARAKWVRLTDGRGNPDEIAIRAARRSAA